MSEGGLATLTWQVLAAAFLLSAALGALVQATGFCTMGAVSDAVILGRWTRMRQWMLAAGVATLGFAALSASGIVTPAQTLYATPKWLWLSALVGGAFFGFGMVLASGCISRNLVRLGGGNLKSLVVALVMAVSAFATLKGLTAVWRVNSVDRVAADVGTNADVASLLARFAGISPAAAGMLAGATVGGALLWWALSSREARGLRSLAGGIGVGLLVLAMWWITGSLGHLPEHPQTLQESWLATNSTRAEGFSFVAPSAYLLDWVLFFSDASKRTTVGIVSVPGVVAGSAAVALAGRKFRWEGFADTADLAHHLAGAALMGIGGVMATGCSIGQGITGLSTLSLASLVAVPAMLAGAVAGVKYQVWRVERMA